MPISSRSSSRTLTFAAALALVLSACTTTPAARPTPSTAWSQAAQVIVVTTAGWDVDHGTLRRFERTQGAGWSEVGVSAPVMVGRSGSAWGLGLHPEPSSGPRKQEGDGRAPAGVFALGTAFGYAGGAATRMPYRGMTADDYCIDVPASPLYNRIVDANVVGEAAVAGSTEPMRRDLHADGDPRYRLGFVIAHNPQARPGAGSCIFAHLTRRTGEPTAGCTAMAHPVMEQVLAWLDPARDPVFVLMPEAEYRRLRGAWGLPALPGAGG